MHNWFECKVKYTKIDENTGKDKSVTEPYLVDALSFTEAESRFVAELEKIISADFMVTNISKCKFTDIFPFDSGDKWYKCKISFVDIDANSGKEKKIVNTMLVLAETLKEAVSRIEESLSTMIVPYDIQAVIESPIMDIFPYSADNEDIPSNLRPLKKVVEEDDDMDLEDNF